MKNSVIITIILSSTFGFMPETRAQYVEYETSSPGFITSAPQKASFDKLRGIIEHENNNHFVSVGDFIKNSPVSNDGSGNLDSGIKTQKLPSANQPIDSLITGKSYNTNFNKKFDSDGIPMAHHQEYPRPSIKNLASDLFEALKINPYPADQ